MNKYAGPIGPEQEFWLSLLESGNYYQTDSHLCILDTSGRYKFCCLGLWQEARLENGERVFCEKETYDNGLTEFLYDGESGILSDKAYKQLGLYGAQGEFCGDYIDNYDENIMSYLCQLQNKMGYYQCVRILSLASMNDAGFTFKNIAKFCRKFPRLVFEKPL